MSAQATIDHAPQLAASEFEALGSHFHSKLNPAAMPSPYWVAQSTRLADELGLHRGWFESDDALQVFSGNALLPNSEPLASVYAGHQFGVWAGQLGDGRALTLGETADGQQIQLKGSGRTPYSRMGDGRAVLRSSIREFLASEAMHALGIPTSRALCVTGSDLPVAREEMETAAVLTRTAPSWIRFGHFEHFYYRGQHDEVKKLVDFVIDRHHPDCRSQPLPALALLQRVIDQTATLMAQWQTAGFMHGVMNTDNMSILGLTIDYGPFQFMDGFNPAHICNHSDVRGRYSWQNQPGVADWNLTALAQTLMPLIEDVALAREVLKAFVPRFEQEMAARMAAKLGFSAPSDEITTLGHDVLDLMAHERTDWAIFWRYLSDHMAGGATVRVQDLFIDTHVFAAWLTRYETLASAPSHRHSTERMQQNNPKFILRNWMAEEVIQSAKQKDFKPLQQLLTVLERPFADHRQHSRWADFPPNWANDIQISCSS